VADHLWGQFAIVPALVMAAEATQKLRIGSFVFNNTFRHPVFLAKEAATQKCFSPQRLFKSRYYSFLSPTFSEDGNCRLSAVLLIGSLLR
jgi:hypothetical protein